MSGVADPALRIEELVIDASAAGSQTALRLAAWARGHQIPVVEPSPALEAGPPSPTDARAAPDRAVALSKRVLRVIRHPGAVLKACTGRTASLLCCNLRVITQTVGCPIDCSYCILQDYQNRSEILVRADPDEVLDQLVLEAGRRPRQLLRVCTGQVGDSLALEPLVGFAAAAVRRCAESKNLLLELKTKTDRVEPLLQLPHGGRTVVSFSLSPSELGPEEVGAAPLAARLGAAARAAAAGYLIGLHLDPMVSLDGDPAAFRGLIQAAAELLPAGRLAYVSMGTVRFPASMRRTVLARFPSSRVTLGELLPEVDGKLRLLRPLRTRLYAAVAAEVSRCFPRSFVYLCMEPEPVWRRALGAGPGSPAEVELALARSLHERFGLAPCAPAPADYSDD